MMSLLVGLFVCVGVVLWSGMSSERLLRLLDSRQPAGGSDTGGTDSGRVGAGGAGSGSVASGRAVADDQLAFDLDLVAICLTSGLPIPVALTLTAEATGDRSGLQRIGREMTIGGEKLAADDRLLPVLEVFEFSEHTGVGPAPLIESVAKELRDSSRRRRQEAAASLGVRLVLPLGVCILPAFLLLSVVPVVISLLSELTTVFF